MVPSSGLVERPINISEICRGFWLLVRKHFNVQNKLHLSFLSTLSLAVTVALDTKMTSTYGILFQIPQESIHNTINAALQCPCSYN